MNWYDLDQRLPFVTRDILASKPAVGSDCGDVPCYWCVRETMGSQSKARRLVEATHAMVPPSECIAVALSLSLDGCDAADLP